MLPKAVASVESFLFIEVVVVTSRFDLQVETVSVRFLHPGLGSNLDQVAGLYVYQI